MLFPEINDRICELREIADPTRRILSLERLYDETRDGMVAYELGVQHMATLAYELAAVWFGRAEVVFPLPEFKQMAREAAERARRLTAPDEGVPPAPVEPASQALPDWSDDELLVVCDSRERVWDRMPNAGRFVPAAKAFVGGRFLGLGLSPNRSDAIHAGKRRWLVLTALYGYVDPWQPVENYPTTFEDQRTGPISLQSLTAQVLFQGRWDDRKPLREFRRVLWAGEDFHGEYVRKSFGSLGLEVRRIQV